MPWNTYAKFAESLCHQAVTLYWSESVVQENRVFPSFLHISWVTVSSKLQFQLPIQWTISEVTCNPYISNVQLRKNHSYSCSTKVKSPKKDSWSISTIFYQAEKSPSYTLWMRKNKFLINAELRWKPKENQIPEITAGIGSSILSRKIYTWPYVSLQSEIWEEDADNSQHWSTVPLLIGSKNGHMKHFSTCLRIS